MWVDVKISYRPELHNTVKKKRVGEVVQLLILELANSGALSLGTETGEKVSPCLRCSY